MTGMTMWPVDSDQPLFALLTYTPTRPHEVRLTFVTDDCRLTASIRVARKLFISALVEDHAIPLNHPTPRLAGQRLGRDRLFLRLWTDGGEMVELYAPRDRIQHAVDRMTDLVPASDESEM